MEERILNIYEKLLLISLELTNVAKNLEVGVGQGKYKAVGEADVLKAIKPLEAKYKVYSYQFSRKNIESGIIENEGVDYKTKEKVIKKNLFERIEVVYRFVNVEKPDDFIDITSYGDGIDSQDKSVGKAMTYADKYALLKAYKIITGDDPDQNASDDLKSMNTSKQEKITEEQAKVLASVIDEKIAKWIYVNFNCKPNELTKKEADTVIKVLKDKGILN